MEPQDDQPQSAAQVLYPNEPMVVQGPRRSRYEFLPVGRTVKPKPRESSSKAHLWLREDRLLGEHPPLEGLHL